MRIELRIDRVVLEGLPGLTGARHADAVREALHAELARLVAGTPSIRWQRARSTRLVSAPDVHTGLSTREVGQQVARSIHSGLTGSRRRGGAR